ncbi:hypothetical protein BH20ACT2_BH20ACT2_06200 [soil metagenome]
MLDEAARPAHPADLAEVVDLARVAIGELALTKGGAQWARRHARPEPLDASVAATLDDDDQHLVVGTIDGSVVGYGAVRRDTLRDGGVIGVIDDLFVDPDARGVGVGEAMMDQLLDWCRRCGCEGVDGLALPGNRATKNFFERYGLVARAILVHKRLT